jgi:hypothetical protein
LWGQLSEMLVVVVVVVVVQSLHVALLPLVIKG